MAHAGSNVTSATTAPSVSWTVAVAAIIRSDRSSLRETCIGGPAVSSEAAVDTLSFGEAEVLLPEHDAASSIMTAASASAALEFIRQRGR